MSVLLVLLRVFLLFFLSFFFSRATYTCSDHKLIKVDFKFVSNKMAVVTHCFRVIWPPSHSNHEVCGSDEFLQCGKKSQKFQSNSKNKLRKTLCLHCGDEGPKECRQYKMLAYDHLQTSYFYRACKWWRHKLSKAWQQGKFVLNKDSAPF